MSTVDWPGQLAATVFLQGCPWECEYCHNCALIDPRAPGQTTFEELISLLERRRGLLDAVVFTGGEPCRQAGLIPAIEKVKEMGFAVGLHTGGAFPALLERALPLIDWVGLDVKALPAHYPQVVGRAGSGEKAWAALDLVVASGIAYEVRVTLAPGSLTVANLPTLLAELSQRGVNTLAIQQARAQGTSEQFQQRMAAHSIPQWDADFAQIAEQVRAANTAAGPGNELAPAGFTHLEIRSA